MNTRHLPGKIAGVILGLTLLLGATAYGQRNRNWDGYPNWGGSFDLRQTALNAGYNEGTKEGRNDRSRNRHSNFQDFSAYQKATKDYNSRLGDRELYRRYFQRAFESGYNTELGIQTSQDRDNRDQDRNIQDRNIQDRNINDNRDQNRRGRNWDRYGTYGGSSDLRQTALNAGYNEGIKDGRNDRRRGRQTDFRSFSAYQKATQDYSSKLGDRELYRRYYREGFENGYADGYNGN